MMNFLHPSDEKRIFSKAIGMYIILTNRREVARGVSGEDYSRIYPPIKILVK
jgi:hypothetical protein